MFHLVASCCAIAAPSTNAWVIKVEPDGSITSVSDGSVELVQSIDNAPRLVNFQSPSHSVPLTGSMPSFSGAICGAEFTINYNVSMLGATLVQELTVAGGGSASCDVSFVLPRAAILPATRSWRSRERATGKVATAGAGATASWLFSMGGEGLLANGSLAIGVPALEETSDASPLKLTLAADPFFTSSFTTGAAGSPLSNALGFTLQCSSSAFALSGRSRDLTRRHAACSLCRFAILSLSSHAPLLACRLRATGRGRLHAQLLHQDRLGDSVGASERRGANGRLARRSPSEPEHACFSSLPRSFRTRAPPCPRCLQALCRATSLYGRYATGLSSVPAGPAWLQSVDPLDSNLPPKS